MNKQRSKIKWKKCPKCDRITLKISSVPGQVFTNNGRARRTVKTVRECIVCDYYV